MYIIDMHIIYIIMYIYIHIYIYIYMYTYRKRELQLHRQIKLQIDRHQGHFSANSCNLSLPFYMQRQSALRALPNKFRSLVRVYIYIYIYTNLPVNAIVRLPHPRSGDSQGQETFLASSAGKKTRNYDTECSNHHPSL